MEPQPGNRIIVITVLAVVLCAVLSGGLVYALQNKQNSQTKNDLQAQITSLQTQVASLSTSPTPSPEATATPTAITSTKLSLTALKNAQYTGVNRQLSN